MASTPHRKRRKQASGDGLGGGKGPNPAHKRLRDGEEESFQGDPTSFESRKLGYFQQHVESLNQQFKDKIGALGPDEYQRAELIACEYLRIMKKISDLYRRPAGDVMAMGNDDLSQLGISSGREDEDKRDEYPPTLVMHPFPSKAIQVVAAGTHSLALCENGDVMSWGNNDESALGRIVPEDQEHLVDKVHFEQGSPGIIQIAAGDNHSLFLSIDGKIYMCGTYKDMDSGKFPNLKPGQALKKGMKQPFPVEIPLPKPVRQIEAGFSWNVAILEDGSLWSWGMGHCGELARSKSMGAKLKEDAIFKGHYVYDLFKTFTGEIYTEEVQNPKTGETETIESYRYHLDLIADKFLKPAPVEWAIDGDWEVLDAACGEIHLVVVARKRGEQETRVFSSGQNQYGQLGHGDQLQRHELTPIKFFDGKQIAQVTAGAHFTMALDVKGVALYAFGRSDYGQLGIYDQKVGKNRDNFEKEPVQVPFPEAAKNYRITEIDAGERHSFAIMDNGDVYSWGFNETATTGHKAVEIDGTADLERPKKVNVMRHYKRDPTRGSSAKVLNVAGGGQHSLFIAQRFM